MSLDPSIYNQVGKVNLGAGLSDILDQQREREAQALQQQQTLASLAQQQQVSQMQQAEMMRKAKTQRGQELNSWLSNAVQSGRPQDEIMQEAIAKGSEIGVAPDVTQRHVASVFASSQAPQGRSDYAFTQAYPDIAAKQRAESMYQKQKPSELQLEPVIGPDGKPTLVQRQNAIGMQPYRAIEKPEKPTNWSVVQTEKGIMQVNPHTGEVRPLGVNAPVKSGKTIMTQEQKDQASLSAQQAIDQANKLLNHPGRLMATGASSFMSSIPGTDARGFKANLDTFKAQTFVPMVSALKGMGALSDAEGKKLTDSVGALDQSMPEAEFENSLKETMDFLYSKAKTAGLNVQNPLEANKTQSGTHPPDISGLLQKYGR